MTSYKSKLKIKNAIVGCFKYVKPKRLLQLYLTITVMLIAAIFEVISIGAIVPLVATIIGGSIPSFISAILDFIFVDVTSDNVNNSDLYIKIGLGFVLIIILSTFFRLVAQYCIIWYTNQIGFDLTNRSYSNILMQDYQFHVGTNSSEVIATINKVQSLIHGVISPVLQS
ncbi:ABC transporter transmembrane domain-containing protein, partial [Paracoccaceae bacterium]|nr:ABC transporter transmembrane domain-containing protein [Paracoccaceae bacterium]